MIQTFVNMIFILRRNDLGFRHHDLNYRHYDLNFGHFDSNVLCDFMKMHAEYYMN